MVLVALLAEAPGLGGLLRVAGSVRRRRSGGGAPPRGPRVRGSAAPSAWSRSTRVCHARSATSVVAPVAALVSAVLPVGVAIAQGGPGLGRRLAGGLVCLIAIVLVSAQPPPQGTPRPGEKGEKVARWRPDGRLRPAAGSRLRRGGGGPVSACSSSSSERRSVRGAGRWRSRVWRDTVVAFGMAWSTRTRLWPHRGAGVARIALVWGQSMPRPTSAMYTPGHRAGCSGWPS